MTDQPETIGDLYNRVPPTGEWIELPEYGMRVRRWADPETVQIMPANPPCPHGWPGGKDCGPCSFDRAFEGES